MSAKWRRSKKNSNRFNIFKAFSRVRNKGTLQVPRIKSSKIKRQAYAKRYKIPQIDTKGTREPEPLIDVFEQNEEIMVVAELAGFSMENLKINVKDQRLTLSAEALDRKFYKSLNLPKRVIPNTIHTTYKNGVLEIRLKKAIEEKIIDNIAG